MSNWISRLIFAFSRIIGIPILLIECAFIWPFEYILWGRHTTFMEGVLNYFDRFDTT